MEFKEGCQCAEESSLDTDDGGHSARGVCAFNGSPK